MGGEGFVDLGGLSGAWKVRVAGCTHGLKWYLLDDRLLSLAGIGA
jgi:hypothetical protein